MSTKQNNLGKHTSKFGTLVARLAVILAFAACESAALAQWPDLVVSSITPSVTNPAPGQTFDVTVTVTNQGNGYANGFYVDIHTDLASEPIDGCFPSEAFGECYGLGAGQSVSWIVPTFYNSAGPHNFWAWADSCPAYVAETNELNNKRGRTIQVGAPSQPDLVIDSISLPLGMTSPRIGEQFLMNVWVRNNGPVATGSFYLSIDTDRATAPTTPCTSEQWTLVAGLGARGAVNDNIQLSFPVTYSTAGSHTFWARADGCANISESNESNNSKSRTSTVIGPDLVVTIVNEGPHDYFQPATDHIIKVHVKNIGTARSTPCQVHSFVDTPGEPTLPCSGQIHSIDAVDPGSAALVIAVVRFNTTGNHSFWIWADACSQITELNESNNKKVATLQVRRGPDLVVRSITLPPQPPTAGSLFPISVVVRNVGDFETKFGESIRTNALLHVIGNPVDPCTSFHFSKSCAGLAAGQNATLTFNVSYPQFGLFNFRAVVDPCGQIAETNNGNNSRDQSVTVLPY